MNEVEMQNYKEVLKHGVSKVEIWCFEWRLLSTQEVSEDSIRWTGKLYLHRVNEMGRDSGNQEWHSVD
jgi:hypothetical protein